MITQTPRDYQYSIVDQSSRKLAAAKAIITHAPTGAGKTLIIEMIVERALRKGKTVLVLSEATKVYNQLHVAMGGREINSEVDKNLFIQPGHCYTGMIQTLNRRPKMIEQFAALGDSLIILIDECHISTFCTLINKLPGALRIGLTATPFAYIHKHLPKYFYDFVEGPQVDDLIQMGHLCTYRHIARTAVDTNILELRNGDYSEESQEKAFGDNKVYAGLFNDLQNPEIPYKKCVIFVASIKAADKLHQELLDHGFAASVYHSQIQNASYELAKFTELGLTNIIVTIKSLSKGWDFKPIDLIVLMHKTVSTSLYLQEIGRASRPIPGVKDRFTCLDYGDNWKQHGLYWDERPYAELWKSLRIKQKREASGVAPMKLCDKCESLISLMARTCEFCGAEQPVTERELAQGALIDITEQYQAMVGRKISSLDPEELAAYAKLKQKAGQAIRVAKAHEVESPGWLEDFGRAMGYASGWYMHQRRLVNFEQEIKFADITLR